MPIRAAHLGQSESTQPHGDSFKTARRPLPLHAKDGPGREQSGQEASWKLTTILRARRFHDVPRLAQLYKSKVLSFVEHRTSAVYHAPKPHWLESMLFRHGFFTNAVSEMKTRFLHVHLLVCCTDRQSEAARGTSETCFSSVFQKHNEQLCSHWSPPPFTNVGPLCPRTS